ncbi:hypothetical protein B0S90_0146 [Caldicellulosiruptor bescii]|uniref:Uncharacterized protein n=2 Tax=Caldicellulosiruptor bescii TaxID=31899 RepID=B9MPT5_CALBD|nr:hypothetical protein [Caldicellulosiruptor bescii]ACM61718.1 hypothetical protein Athe_2654 [Caldicellulosiruptor bescii DSM 6725]PBC88480.1 hypothetical protein B0S87_1479 [Caldicellulosiruptor bescii]PBC92039.1 hypothetical protein B0S89_2514 [Caldicellulosiruptor bescii]PBD02548.1 hypothetical protein B0S85_0061 [Caldicellulosiruptor bescii]PBD05218.1 hypothetical protein B0S90_0146 [Caldicellulosiruptor bescii]
MSQILGINFREKIKVIVRFVVLVIMMITIFSLFKPYAVKAEENNNRVSFIYEPLINIEDKLYKIKHGLYSLNIMGLFDLLERKGYTSDLIQPVISNESNSNNFIYLIAEKFFTKGIPFLNILQPSGNFFIQSKLNETKVYSGLDLTREQINTGLKDVAVKLKDATAIKYPFLESVKNDVKLPDGIVPDATVSIERILKEIIEDKGNVENDTLYGRLNSYVFDWPWFKVIDSDGRLVNATTARDHEKMLFYAQEAFNPNSRYRMFMIYRFDKNGNLNLLDSYNEVASNILFNSSFWVRKDNNRGEKDNNGGEKDNKELKFNYVTQVDVNSNIGKIIMEKYRFVAYPLGIETIFNIVIWSCSILCRDSKRW